VEGKLRTEFRTLKDSFRFYRLLKGSLASFGFRVKEMLYH